MILSSFSAFETRAHTQMQSMFFSLHFYTLLLRIRDIHGVLRRYLEALQRLHRARRLKLGAKLDKRNAGFALDHAGLLEAVVGAKERDQHRVRGFDWQVLHKEHGIRRHFFVDEAPDYTDIVGY